MRIRKTELLALAALVAVAGSAPAAPPEVPNAGLEQFAAGAPADWQFTNGEGADAALSVVASAHTGSGLRLVRSTWKGSSTLSSKTLPAESKTSYLLTAWLKTDALSSADVYLSVPQFKDGTPPKSRGILSGPVQPLYTTAGQWRQLRFYFTTSADTDLIQICLTAAGAPIDLQIDDIALEKVDTAEYKPLYEPADPETLLPQENVQKVLETRPRATAEMRRVGDRPRIFIDGQESIPVFYKGTGPWKFVSKAQIGDFSQAGVHVFFIPYIMGRGVYQTKPTGCWISHDQFDFSELDALMWRVLRADPQAYIMFDLSMDPYATWGAEHPDDVVTNEKGQKAVVNIHTIRFGGEPQKTTGSYAERYGYSYVSPALREESTEALLRFDAHIRASLPGKAVIGYYLHGGDDGQMFGWEDRLDQLVDYSPAGLTAFRAWLKTKYPSDQALQTAWHRPDVTIETATVPDARRRTASSFFLDPSTEQDILDYKRSISEGMVDAKIAYAEALRKAHGSPLLLGSYYSGPTIGIPSHRATGRLLDSGQFNLITSVLQYGATRVPGGVGKAHQAWQSLTLHNSIGIAEEDFRSWKSAPTTPEWDAQLVARAETPEAIGSLIRRDTGDMLANGQGVWWYDMDGGWFSDPRIMKPVQESIAAFRSDLKQSSIPKAEVAVFIDEYSQDCINNQNTRPFRAALNSQILALNASGVPYHTYLQSDLANPKLPDYKLYVFLDAYHLSKPEYAAIQKLKRDGKTLTFIHAPGVVSQDVTSTGDPSASITQITGLTVHADGEHPLTLDPTQGTAYYFNSAITPGSLTAPAFAVEDPKATPIANYRTTGKTAVASRDYGTWKSVFFGGWGMTSNFFNTLAKQSGAWVASTPGTAVYASDTVLTVHAMYPGPRTIKLLHAAKVIDQSTGQAISPNTSELNLNLVLGETRWFRLDAAK